MSDWATETDRVAILTDFANNKISLSAVIETLGVSRQRIYQLLERHGLADIKRQNGRRPGGYFRSKTAVARLSDADVAAITSGATTIDAVALAHGVCHHTIGRELQRLGVKATKTRIVIGDADIAAYTADSITGIDLAAKYKCSLAAISLALRRQGVRKRSPRRREINLTPADAARLMAGTATMKQIAAEMGISGYLLLWAVRRAGIVTMSLAKCRISDADAIRLRDGLVTTTRLAAEMGFAYSTVHAAIRRQGLTTYRDEAPPAAAPAHNRGQ